MEKKSLNTTKVIIICISLVLLIGIVGITFAFYSNTVSANTQRLIVGDMWVRFNTGDKIEISNSAPSETEPSTFYAFTVSGKNTSNNTIVYDINITRGDLPDGKTESQRIADRFIKFTLKRSTDGTNFTDVVTRQSYNDFSNWIRLYVDNVGTTNGVTYYYRLYVWVGDDVLITGGRTQGGDYSDTEWPSMFANVKVKVTGDFENKTVPVYINLNPNGGEVSSSMIELASNATSYGTLPTPTRSGYAFDGWYTAKTGGEKVESNATYTHGSSATTLYAHWNQVFRGTAAQLANQATTFGLENVADAYRYVGADPDNYVWFNNEQWRIIGVYGDNLKIIKATPSTTGQQYYSSTSSGNAWSGSTMQSSYLYTTYWNTLSADAKAMIEESASWNVGAAAYNATASQAYTSATGTKWTGKIGLVASYEYLYAATSDCWSVAGNSYNNSCYTKDWLFSTLLPDSSYYAWTLSPISGNSSVALYVGTAGDVGYYYVDYSFAASPAVYLKSTISITGGNGKVGETNSYKLG